MKKVTLLFCILFIIGGCATTQSPIIQAKSTGIMMMNVYHAAYVDVKTVLSNPSSTPQQQELARAERAILVKVKPLLDIYMDTVNNGGIPPQEASVELNSLIDQLIMIGGK